MLPAEAGTEFVIWDVAAFASRTSLPSLRCVLIVFFMRALGAFLFWKLFLLWPFRFGRLWLFLLPRFFRFRLGLYHAVAERFQKPENRALVLARESPAELLQALEEWRPMRVEKWLDRDTR